MTNKHRPALRIFAGFRIEHAVPEKRLRSTRSVRSADTMLEGHIWIDDRVVQGPTLKVAVRFAPALRCRLSAVTVLPLLRHADLEVRAIACGLARPRVDVNAALIDFLIRLRTRSLRKIASRTSSKRTTRRNVWDGAILTITTTQIDCDLRKSTVCSTDVTTSRLANSKLDEADFFGTRGFSQISGIETCHLV